MTRYPLYSRWGEPQFPSGRVWKIWPKTGFDPRTVQYVASRCTDWANPPKGKTVTDRRSDFEKNRNYVLSRLRQRELWKTPSRLKISAYSCWPSGPALQAFRSKQAFSTFRLHFKCDGTRWRTGEEVKGKLVNRAGSQYSSHYLGTWCIQHYYRWCAHLGCAVVDWTDVPRPI